MEFRSQTNQQPASQAQPQHAPAAHRPTGPVAPRGGNGGRRVVALVVTVIVVLAIIAAGVFAWSKLNGSNGSQPDKGKYQAVFMTNGQVYFGKLEGLGGHYITLTDIYYLQVQSQQGTNTKTSATDQVNSNSNVSLTKLGSELHGPTDKMNIASDQVLFWEDLKGDSKVVQAISDYQKKQ